MVALPGWYSLQYFELVNIRMMATPSSAIDLYNNFFASHPYTWFCQISFLKPLMRCPYQEPLSIVMDKAYGLGNFNASLFATRRHRLGRAIFRAAGGVAVRTCHGDRQPAVRGPARSLRPDLRRYSSPVPCSTYRFTTVLLTHGAAIPVSAVVCYAARDFRTGDRTDRPPSN